MHVCQFYDANPESQVGFGDFRAVDLPTYWDREDQISKPARNVIGSSKQTFADLMTK